MCGHGSSLTVPQTSEELGFCRRRQQDSKKNQGPLHNERISLITTCCHVCSDLKSVSENSVDIHCDAISRGNTSSKMRVASKRMNMEASRVVTNHVSRSVGWLPENQLPGPRGPCSRLFVAKRGSQIMRFPTVHQEYEKSLSSSGPPPVISVLFQINLLIASNFTGYTLISNVSRPHVRGGGAGGACV